MFRGTGLQNGSSLSGVIASDFDHVISGAPANIEILAHSPISDRRGHGEWITWGGDSYSDMIYFTNPASKAGVIDTGNNVWIGDLRPCAATTTCDAPTSRRSPTTSCASVGQGPAGQLEPVVPNASSVSPAGS